MKSNETNDGHSAVLSTDGLGAWEVDDSETGYNSRDFWTVRRRNPARKGWSMGWETLLSKGRQQSRRFYTLEAARKEVEKLNASNSNSTTSNIALSNRDVV